MFPFLRLEHPYMKVDETMLAAMSKCSTLQRVCIIAKAGTMDAEGVKDFFEEVGCSYYEDLLFISV